MAARLALTLHPKVKALLLLAALVPKDVDLRSLKLLLVVLYGEIDSVVKPTTITRSFSHMPGVAFAPNSFNLSSNPIATL